jgi:hypothetical protein
MDSHGRGEEAMIWRCCASSLASSENFAIESCVNGHKCDSRMLGSCCIYVGQSTLAYTTV